MTTAQATTIVVATLAAALPPNVPASHQRIDRVTVNGARWLTAHLTMFDGGPATVDFRRWQYGWSTRYTELPGGAVSWENGRWQRYSM